MSPEDAPVNSNINRDGTQGKPIPTLTQAQLSHMLPSQIPTVYRDAEPPYQVHETDGLSRNPNDCAKWGCIDNNR
jgi:hypothetical protein